jgi:hypothetical protein
MRFLGFIGPEYTLRSKNVDCQRCVNLFPEMDELGTGKAKEVASLQSTPGLELLVTLGTSPIRAMWTSSLGVLYVVAGNTLYSVSDTWAATTLGTLLTSTGPVSIADNGTTNQSAISSGLTTYTFTASVLTASLDFGAGYTINGILYTCQANYTTSDTSLVFTTPNVVGGPSPYPGSAGTLTLAGGIGPATITFIAATFTTYSTNQVVLVDGEYGYVWDTGTSTFAQITDPGFLGAAQVVYQDTYFIFNQAGTQQFFLSDQNATTFSSPQVAAAEANPDALVAILSSHENLWLFGTQTTEVWYDSGAADFAFQPVSGAIMEVGCCAPFSVAKSNNTVFWLGSDENGIGIAYMANGYQAQRISTHAVEFAIQGYGVISDCVAYCYQQDGHSFYVLNFQSAGTTWVYDATTSLWHERAFTALGQLDRHLAQCHALAYSTHVVGDYSSGNLYEMNTTIYTDNGSPITRLRVAPHITDDLKRMFYSTIQLDMETGVGLDGIQQGTNPQAMLQFSDDGGHSWSNEKWSSFGMIGQRLARCIWRKLGQSRDRVFKIVITDPVPVTLIGVEMDVVSGNN